MILRTFFFFAYYCVVYTACNHSSSNIDFENEKEVRHALETTWEAEYMETRGSRNKVPKNMATHVVLKKNGTY